MTLTRHSLVPVWLASLCLAACVPSASAAEVCASEVIERLPSPDGSRTAVLFARSCGDGGAVSTHVSVTSSGNLAKLEQGNAVILGEAPVSAPWGGAWAGIRWAVMLPGKNWPQGTVQGRALVVLHDSDAPVLLLAPQVAGVSVTLEARTYQPEKP